jgi:DNA-binding response OmpR family regulator
VPPARHATVLVVEDDRALRTFYRSALMLAGYNVVTAEDGIQALSMVDGYQPAAVVLDLGLPRMSGRDVGAELAMEGGRYQIPIVVVTGGDTSDIDESQYACVLRKPVTPEALIKAVASCLREHGHPGP